MENLGVTSETYTPISVLGGDHPPIRRAVTIASGAGVLAAGTVLGKITASGKYDAYDNTASDGTETAVSVLEHGVDATSADAIGIAIIHGEVNSAALTGLDDAGIADLEYRTVFVQTNVL